MEVILISGKARSGKDTAAEIIMDIVEENDKRSSILITHFAEFLKHVCREKYNWNGEKDEYGRSLLQYVGTAVREQDPDYWVNMVIGGIRIWNPKDLVIIPDFRYPNEMTRLIEEGYHCTHIRIERDGLVSPLTPEQQAHSSETALDNITPDYVIHNNTTLTDFKAALNECLEEIYGKKTERLLRH